MRYRFVKSRREGFVLFRIQRQPDRHGMPSPMINQTAAAFQNLHQVDPRDTAAGTFGENAVRPKNDAGPVKSAGQPARHDPDDTGMPIRIIEHVPGLVPASRVNHLFSFKKYLSFDFLPFGIEPVERPGALVTTPPIVTEKHFYR